jgi:2,4-dienoyl-CoA reductase-like NADH-dependent reductase (Old Yellow Enzyme family)
MTSQYGSVLNPIKINQITLPNRIIFPAIQTNYANLDGTVSDKLITFYSKIAKSGCGLIFTGAAAVSYDSVSANRIMRIDSDECISGLTRLFCSLQEYGCVSGIQLMHTGRQALKSITGHDLLAPSAIPCPALSINDPTYRVREMTMEDIRRVKDDFVTAAMRAANAGVKVIEIHAAHGYLLSGFLSPYSNHRTDEYGGNVSNRTRIICEIIKKIRGTLQQKVAISVRVSGNEFVDGGLTPADFQKIIPFLECAGMDMLNVSVGVAETVNYIIPNASFRETPFVDIAEKIKQFTHVPVCAVGSISSLNIAEKIISSQKVDLVAIGRSQIADADWVKKSMSENGKNIRKCLRCNKCLYWANGDAEMRCPVNFQQL